MSRDLLLILLMFFSAFLHAGEIYRWTDERGGVFYSDQPPPVSARQASKVRSKGNVVDVDKESYEARQARDRNPVLLYANACGPICDQARDHLTQRGIAFTVKDPAKEPEIAVELKKLVGVVEVPVIVVGKTHQKGFEPTSWDSLLDAAGYPKTPLIPVSARPQKQP
jgi:glutaredoxin